MSVIQPVNVPHPVKLTVEQFEMLDASGAFDGYAKTELIEGAIYAMNSQYSAHALAKSELGVRLAVALKALASPLRMIVEGTVDMRPVSAPEPDIALAELAVGVRAYIPLESVALIVEVSDSSIVFDLNEKADLYARHRVPEYWVLDLTAGMMHQLWEPGSAGFAKGRSVPLGDVIESITLPDLRVESDGLI
jgi:Uma2 family endonuclease